MHLDATRVGVASDESVPWMYSITCPNEVTAAASCTLERDWCGMAAVVMRKSRDGLLRLLRGSRYQCVIDAPGRRAAGTRAMGGSVDAVVVVAMREQKGW